MKIDEGIIEKNICSNNNVKSNLLSQFLMAGPRLASRHVFDWFMVSAASPGARGYNFCVNFDGLNYWQSLSSDTSKLGMATDICVIVLCRILASWYSTVT
jgi:hypothetical protein